MWSLSLAQSLQLLGQSMSCSADTLGTQWAGRKGHLDVTAIRHPTRQGSWILIELAMLSGVCFGFWFLDSYFLCSFPPFSRSSDLICRWNLTQPEHEGVHTDNWTRSFYEQKRGKQEQCELCEERDGRKMRRRRGGLWCEGEGTKGSKLIGLPLTNANKPEGHRE